MTTVPSVNQTKSIPLLSLFSGPGGLDIGFEQEGFVVPLALDIHQAAINTYNFNRPNAGDPAKVADLSDVPIRNILDWWEDRVGKGVSPVGIIGGPPCQAFSVSNVYRLVNDPRAKLPLVYARILKHLNKHFGLDFFLFENVAGLGNRPHANSLELFTIAFQRAGFNVKRFYLDAADFGVPQYRKRMFLVGFNKARYPALNYSEPVGEGAFVSVRDTISHLPEPLRYERGCHPVDLGLHPNHWCMKPKSKKFGTSLLKPGLMLGRSFRMLDWDDRSWTVAYGHREVHVHPSGERRLSVYEAMLLQGFPKDYELRGTLSDQIRQVSDAVPPPLARVLAASIRTALDGVSGFAPKADKHQRDIGQLSQDGTPTLHTVAPRSTNA